MSNKSASKINYEFALAKKTELKHQKDLRNLKRNKSNRWTTKEV